MTPGLLKYPGGKSYLAKRIIAEFHPGWVHYVEPFVGGGAVLLALPPSCHRAAGDVDLGLIELYRAVRSGSKSFYEAVDALRYDEATFEFWKHKEPESLRELALRTLVVRRFSRGGSGTSFAWSERLRGGLPGDLNAWNNFKKRLPELTRRLREVEFYCTSAIGLMRLTDTANTLFYLDPPYVHETRVSKGLYDYEMTLGQHKELVEVARELRGQCCISGYSHPLYEDLGWRRVAWDMPCHRGQTSRKSRREEVLWCNR